jgi:hypothetical protein
MLPVNLAPKRSTRFVLCRALASGVLSSDNSSMTDFCPSANFDTRIQLLAGVVESADALTDPTSPCQLTIPVVTPS